MRGRIVPAATAPDAVKATAPLLAKLSAGIPERYLPLVESSLAIAYSDGWIDCYDQTRPLIMEALETADTP